jgi:hypothetical protein
MYKWNAAPKQPEESRDGHPESSLHHTLSLWERVA